MGLRSTLGRCDISIQHLVHGLIKFGWSERLEKNGLESMLGAVYHHGVVGVSTAYDGLHAWVYLP